ncbi:hypothetical protein EVG20_g6400 [Dentipellis fragilis]|uniref:BTB domain-containing protein n=1 Tax=Dentipellis fragilis TaxID=205917 RepID=A0A4Y9YLD5_9AGAM|nr:hypothetical protein EVG20_g6400 [Dentipellis fragilis]
MRGSLPVICFIDCGRRRCEAWIDATARSFTLAVAVHGFAPQNLEDTISVSSLYFTDFDDFDVPSSPDHLSPQKSPTFTIGTTSPDFTTSMSGHIVPTVPAADDESDLLISGIEHGDYDRRSEPAGFKKHERFYFEDGNVTFLVKGILYRVHRYFFQRDSSYFRGVLGRSGVTSTPISLDDDIRCSDFDAFLSILYPATIASAVDKVVLERAYGIESWLRPGFVALCDREQLPTREEGLRLRASDILLIMTVREGMRARRLDASRSELEVMVDSHMKLRDHISTTAKKAGTDQTANKIMDKETTQMKPTEKLPSTADTPDVTAHPSFGPDMPTVSNKPPNQHPATVLACTSKDLWKRQLERAKSRSYLSPPHVSAKGTAASMATTTTAATSPRDLYFAASKAIRNGVEQTRVAPAGDRNTTPIGRDSAQAKAAPSKPSEGGTSSQSDAEDAASTVVNIRTESKRKEMKDARRKKRASLNTSTAVSPPSVPSPAMPTVERASVLEEDNWKTVTWSRPAKKDHISSEAIARSFRNRGIASSLIASSSAGYHEFVTHNQDSEAEAEEKWEAKQRAKLHETFRRDSRQEDAWAW